MKKDYWSPRARSLTPYTAGEQPKEKLIKLNTNENPYPPSPRVADAVSSAADSLNLYPPADGGSFREAAAKLHDLDINQVFCANGSDEVLAMAFQALLDPAVPVHTLDVSYSFYPVWADLFDLTLAPVPLKGDWAVDASGFADARSVVLANPNAPVGILMPEQELRKLIEKTPGPVIVDEAYGDFGSYSAVPWIREYDNLLVVRTLSKSYSLAGVRAGYAVGHSDLIEALMTIKDSMNSYPIDRLAIAAAAAALEDQEWHDLCCGRVIRTRERTRQTLLDLGYEVLPSNTNFLFVKCRDAEGTFRRLREHGILVRYFGKGRTRDYLRVTIGTDIEMNTFLKAMEDLAA